MVQINNVIFTEEESAYVVTIIENVLKFWADAKKDMGEFPWEMFPEDAAAVNELIANNTIIKKLKQAGVNTFDLETFGVQ